MGRPRITFSPIVKANTAEHLKRMVDIAKNERVPIDFVVNVKPNYGTEKLQKVILSLLVILQIASTYINKRFFAVIISSPLQTYKNIKAIVDAIKEIIAEAPGCIDEIKDLTLDELKKMNIVLIEAIQTVISLVKR